MAALTRDRERWSGESGAELIEFALVLPLLLLVVLGIIDFGFLFQRYEVVTNAAREGARVAILPGYEDADIVARVNQYLTAGGLTGAHAPPVISRPPAVNIGLHCLAVTSVTVTYPHNYSFVAGIASFFGASEFGSGSVLRGISEMRNELPGRVCP